MAERVSGFEFKRGPQRYDWEQWADGSQWKLIRGVDYTCEDHVMRSAVYTHAERVGKRASTKAVDGGLVIQFRGRDDQ